LWDNVHQSLHGRTRVWDDVARHLNHPDRFTYAPESLERRIAVAPPAKTATEQVRLNGPWTAGGGAVRTSEHGARLEVQFTGNQIDLIGRKTPGGGTLNVLIDGQPAQQAPVFLTSFIEAHPAKRTRSPEMKWGGSDTAPHAVDLGKNVVPQAWTIAMTSDTGDYRIDGSVSGADGEGNVAQAFLSRSGQIGIDPAFWRFAQLKRPEKPVVYGSVSGDKYTFDVFRAGRGEVNFRGDPPAQFSVPLIQNLPNRRHTLELVAAGDGEIMIEGLYVREPMEKE
jgi:hypothetical protein